MPHLLLRLSGPFQATLDGQPATGFESNKVRALLAYLAVEAARPHARESLAGLLWPDYPDRAALSNLRSALANLRQAIGDPQADPPFLFITRDTIQFNVASDHALDVATLRNLARQPVDQLEQAVGAYRGDFLEGFSLADSPPFEEWVLAQREQLRLCVEDALHRLAAHYETTGAYDRAMAVARRALALEPWNEETHRQVMRALALSGQRSQALAQYETCRRLLRQELGVDPAQETVALAESIRTETLRPTVSAPFADHGAEAEPPTPGEPPFKGLAYFDEADAGLFFGRATLIASLAAQVQTWLTSDYTGRRFLAVIGASGSGKSSVVRAGLIPALRQAFGEAIHSITPTARPLEALALSLTRSTPGVAATAALLDNLAADSRSLHLSTGRLAQTPRLLLVVDQFEELFTLCHDETERRAFVDNLLYAAQSPGSTVVVIALRADFYAACAPFGELRQALSQGQHYIGALSASELRQAIEEPARRTGWTFEPGLVDLLLREVGDAPGALPLLSHALLETWRRRQGRTLTLAGYGATGGVSRAIARTADTTYLQLTPAQQAIARTIFLRLTELGSSGDEEDAPGLYTRRRVALAELIPQSDAANGVQLVLRRIGDALNGQVELTLPAHGDMIWGLAFSPDGQRLATTSWDRTTRVWDLATGEEIAAYTGHTDMVFGVVFSSDGQRVYTASDRYTRELDATTGKELRRFYGDGLDVYATDLSPDGKLLAQGRADGSVVLWDLVSGEKLRQLTGHGGLVLDIAFSRDGQRLATASFDKFAKLWDVASGVEVGTFFGNGGNVFGVALSSNARRLATTGGDGTLRLYTLDLAELVELAQARVPRALTHEECQRYLHGEACP